MTLGLCSCHMLWSLERLPNSDNAVYEALIFPHFCVKKNKTDKNDLDSLCCRVSHLMKRLPSSMVRSRIIHGMVRHRAILLALIFAMSTMARHKLFKCNFNDDIYGREVMSQQPSTVQIKKFGNTK